MSIRDELLALSTSRGPQCRVAIFLSSLDPKERVEVEELLKDRAITSAAWARWCDKRGVRVLDQSWSRHRRGECSCGHR